MAYLKSTVIVARFLSVELVFESGGFQRHRFRHFIIKADSNEEIGGTLFPGS